MDHNYSAQDGLLEVRPLRLSDIECLRKLRNLDAIRFAYINSEIISKEGQELWFKRYQDNDNDFMFVISHEQTSVGFAALYDFDRDEETVEFGRFMIDPMYQGHNYGRRALMLILTIAFNKLKAKRITLEVLEKNAAAISLYRSVGFKLVSQKNGLIKMKNNSDAKPDREKRAR